jgi:hypothetical protein
VTAVLLLAAAWACTSVVAVAVLLVLFREPDPVALPARKCGSDCGPCAVADDAAGARLDLDMWAMEMQERAS